jgi:hypothetical protein
VTNPNEILPWLALGFSIFAAGATWLLADARGKGRSDALEAVAAERQRAAEAIAGKVGVLEVQLGMSKQAWEEVHRGLDRIDAQKASREAVDGVRTEIASLRQHIDTRLESLQQDIREALSKSSS